MTSMYKFQHYALPVLAQAAKEIPVAGKALAYYLHGINEYIEDNVAPEVRDPDYYVQKIEDVPIANELESTKGKKYRGAGDTGPRTLKQIKKVRQVHPIDNENFLELEPVNAPKINPIIPPPFAPIIPPYYLPHYGFTEHYEPQIPVIQVQRGQPIDIAHPPRTKQPNATMPPAGGFTNHVGFINRKQTVSGFTGKPIQGIY